MKSYTGTPKQTEPTIRFRLLWGFSHPTSFLLNPVSKRNRLGIRPCHRDTPNVLAQANGLRGGGIMCGAFVVLLLFAVAAVMAQAMRGVSGVSGYVEGGNTSTLWGVTLTVQPSSRTMAMLVIRSMRPVQPRMAGLRAFSVIRTRSPGIGMPSSFSSCASRAAVKFVMRVLPFSPRIPRRPAPIPTQASRWSR